MSENIYLAFYKGRKTIKQPKDLLAWLSDGLIRLFTKSQYSHCEIAVYDEILQYPPHITLLNGMAPPTQYRCYSASNRDGGVRMKEMPLPADKWDLVPLPNISTKDIHALYQVTKGQGYDLAGVLGIVLPLPQAPEKWFCSEWCGFVLGISRPWRYSPQMLYEYLKKNPRF